LTASLDVFGESKRTNETKRCLALALLEMRCFEESRILYDELLKSTKRTYGEISVDIAEAYLHLARFHADRGPLSKAKEYFQLAIEVFKKSTWLAADLVSVQMELASHYACHGKLLMAESLGEEVLGQCQNTLNLQHRTYVEAQRSMARIKKAMRKYDDAQARLTALVKQLEKSKCHDVKMLHSLRCDLGGILVRNCQCDKAETLLEETLSEVSQEHSEDRKLMSGILKQLAAAKNGLGKHEEAEKYQRQAMAKGVGNVSPRT
jgi:tetratricopeptide (TPR) repeat protein